MKNKRFLVLIAALSLVGASALLVACGGSASTGDNTNAQQQFLTDRGAGTPGPGTPTAAAAGQTGTGAGDGFGGVFGTIDAINGSKLTVTNFNGATTTVQLASDGKIFKQVTATSADIKVGDVILAAGARSAEVITATTVQVGTLANLSAGDGGRPLGGFRGGAQDEQFPQRTPVAGRTPGARRGAGTPVAGATHAAGADTGSGTRGRFTPALGTVEKIEGDTITIKPIAQTEATPGTAAASATATATIPVTTVKLTSTTRIQKQTEIALTDLKTGTTVTASGTQNGNVFNATRLQVVDNSRFQQTTP